jgi:hypothetical protein
VSSILSQVVRWLRAGYPEGVPERDYVPLFALLGKNLSAEDVTEVADELSSEGGQDHKAAVEAALSAATREAPGDSDIARVGARLAAGGWPLAKPGT